MSYQNDVQHGTANDAITTLAALDLDTTPADDPMLKWNRVRDAVRNLDKPDATPIWAAIAAGDTKATDKAATAYMTSQAIATAAKADTRREDPFRAEAMSVVKRLVIEAQDEARNIYNTNADTYTTAFREAGNQPDPATLIVSENGSKVWADLIQAAQAMNRAAAVLKLAAQFGRGVKDQGTGLAEQVPFAIDLPNITAVETAKQQHDWLNTRTHGAHKQWATFILAGGELYAGTVAEQEAEVERLVTHAEAGRRMPRLADRMSDEDKALKRAAKKALRGKA